MRASIVLMFFTMNSNLVHADLEKAKSLMKKDPIEASSLAQEAPDSDKKFLLLHEIDKQMSYSAPAYEVNKPDVKKLRAYMQEYYVGKVKRFSYYEPSGSYEVTRYWLNKTKKDKTKIADFDLAAIRPDADGCPGLSESEADKLRKKYIQWVKNYPKHPKAGETKLLIKRIIPYSEVDCAMGKTLKPLSKVQ